MTVRSLLVGMCLLGTWTASAAETAAPSPAGHLPYRFLLVIADQWKDPASYLIDEEGEFRLVATLLKTWGIPFDILRLDQQRLDRHYLMDREGRPRYGTIIWDAVPTAAMEGRELGMLPVLVEELGVNLVILGDAVSPAEISTLAGIEYLGEITPAGKLAFVGEHFLTRTVAGREKEIVGSKSLGSKVLVKEATVLARRGENVCLTVRQFPKGGRVVWIDAHRPSAQIGSQLLRDLFKRSLVWAQRYALYVEYPRTAMLFMDDFGTSDRTYLPYWHYRTLNEEDIRKGLIEPLKRHHAVLMQNIITGYVDRKTHRVLVPWTQQVTDEIDGRTLHDYVSAKRGLDAGLREGVFEIQSHGYTHMLPDLESPPGPFRDLPMNDRVPRGFDVEFHDKPRNRDIPAIVQKFHMARGIECLQADFGVRPLVLMVGGFTSSHSYPHHTYRIAAELGFGFSGVGGYLGRDLVIANMKPIVSWQGWEYTKRLRGAEVPWSIDAPSIIVFHDRDVSLDITAAERLLTALGEGVRYLSGDEYTGYLHAQVARADAPGRPPALAIVYDEHYCRYFGRHPSQWTLHLADDLRLDAKDTIPEKRTITIPKGLGRHLVPLGVKP